jgi:hypothetical protein
MPAGEARDAVMSRADRLEAAMDFETSCRQARVQQIAIGKESGQEAHPKQA